MNAQMFSNLIEKYADLQELDARILNELIDRIIIHEKEIINGEKFQTVKIYYKFVGVVWLPTLKILQLYCIIELQLFFSKVGDIKWQNQLQFKTQKELKICVLLFLRKKVFIYL